MGPFEAKGPVLFGLSCVDAIESFGIDADL